MGWVGARRPDDLLITELRNWAAAEDKGWALASGVDGDLSSWSTSAGEGVASVCGELPFHRPHKPK